ncbi:MAG: hypothetical protein JW738_09665 [Actinobacteria bacterium]|nr:hypothetical protein [Actinomycetota bacterium]
MGSIKVKNNMRYSDSQSVNKLLMVAFFFPPHNKIPALRPQKFAKYLPKFNWQATVLTSYFPEPDDPEDGKLSQISEDTKVIRAYFPDLLKLIQKLVRIDPGKDTQYQLMESGKLSQNRISSIAKSFLWPALNFARDWLAFPDKWITWIPFAMFKGCIEMRRESYDAIYSTFGPGTNHIVAFLLKKIFNVPWVAEYRDFWSQNFYLGKSAARRRIEASLEKRIIKDADWIIAGNEPYIEELLKLHKGKENAISSITNGFDPEDHKIDVKPIRDKFVIVFTGQLIRMQRNPIPLISVVRNLVNKSVIKDNKFILTFYTTWEPELERAARDLIERGFVEIHSFVPRSEALHHQKEATALFHVMMDDPLEKLGHGSKIFEYMGARRPILAYAPQGGEVVKLLEETQTGKAATSEHELETILEQWITEFDMYGSVDFEPNEKRLRMYTRESLTGEFVKVLNNIVGAHE